MWFGLLREEPCPLHVVFQVDLRVAHQSRVQGRLSDVNVPRLDEGLHLAHEERQQQGTYVRPVDVGVGEENDLVVADLGQVEVVGHTGADGEDERLDLGVLEHLVDTCLLDVQDLSANRQDRLGARVTGVLGGAERGETFDDE